MFTYCYGGHEETEPLIEWDTWKALPPSQLFVAGQVLDRNFQAEHVIRRAADPWIEHESCALAVHPHDIKKAKAHYKKNHGIDVDFNEKTGWMKMRGSTHQRRILQAESKDRGTPIVNHDAYFG